VKDYNTDYLQAEYEVLSQMLSDIESRKNLQRVQELYDQSEGLKKNAKLQNLYTVHGGREVYEQVQSLRAQIKDLQESPDAKESYVRQQLRALHEELNPIDVLAPFRIAKVKAKAVMGKVLAESNLNVPERFKGWAEQLAEEYRANKDKEYEPADVDVGAESFFAFAKWMADRQDAAAYPARAFFKAIAEERKYIREQSGDAYVTFLDLVPKGATVWQPERGNRFYRGLTIADTCNFCR
jgi:hypothetical protein